MTTADLAARADFALGAVIVSPSTRALQGPLGSVDVEPRVMQVVVVLAEAEGHVVTRETLFARCWGGVYVGDDSLNRAVAAARRALSASGSDWHIETIPRTGYLLKDPGRMAATDARSTTPPVPFASRRSFLVVAGGAVSIASASYLLWNDHGRIDPRYGDLIERGRAALRDDTYAGNQRATALFAQAASLRPGAAEGWGLLAYSAANDAENQPENEVAATLDTAERAARRALSIDPQEPNALMAMVVLRGSMADWATIDRQLRHVLEVDPRNSYAMSMLVALLQSVGFNHESWVWNERLIAIEPMAPNGQKRRAFKLWIAGRIADADRAITRAMELWPKNEGVWLAKFIILAFTDRPRAALAMLNDDRTRPSSMPPPAIAVWRKALGALDQPTPANLATARSAIIEGARGSPGLAAVGVMMLGALKEVDAAFEVADGFLLSRGSIAVHDSGGGTLLLNDRNWRWTQWLFTPPSAVLRADARFLQLCDGVGLSAYWKSRGLQPDYLRREVSRGA